MFKIICSSLLLSCLSFAKISSMPIRGNPFVIAYDQIDYQNTKSMDSEQDIDTKESDFGVRTPLWKSDEIDIFAFASQYDLNFANEFEISSYNNFRVPKNLRSQEVGAGFQLADVAVTAALSASGEDGFNSGTTSYYNINVIFDKKDKTEGDGNWSYIFNISNSRGFLKNVPLPGISYNMTGENYVASIGLPVIFYMYREPGNFSFRTFISPFGSNIEISKQIFWVSVFTKASWEPKSFDTPFLEENTTEEERANIIYDRKDWELGLKFQFGRFNFISASYTQSIDRRVFIGENVFQPLSKKEKWENTDAVQLNASIGF